MSIVFVSGYATFAPGNSDASEPNVADAATSFEKVLPALVSLDDYASLNTVSKVYFALATAYKRMNDAPAACAALSQSLDYYLRALAKEPHTPSYERAVSLNDAEDEGLKEVRARFGCESTQVRFDDSGIPVAQPSAPLSLTEVRFDDSGIPVARASLASMDDYGSLSTVSEVYFALATAYKRVNQVPAACAALSRSLDYYRLALAKEPHTPSYERAAAVSDHEDDGIREVRSQFGCAGTPSRSPAQYVSPRGGMPLSFTGSHFGR
jgi:tetratricopeptide (TPR) repeat protein